MHGTRIRLSFDINWTQKERSAVVTVSIYHCGNLVDRFQLDRKLTYAPKDVCINLRKLQATREERIGAWSWYLKGNDVLAENPHHLATDSWGDLGYIEGTRACRKLAKHTLEADLRDQIYSYSPSEASRIESGAGYWLGLTERDILDY